MDEYKYVYVNCYESYTNQLYFNSVLINYIRNFFEFTI
jgi:hypothetical protein